MSQKIINKANTEIVLPKKYEEPPQIKNLINNKLSQEVILCMMQFLSIQDLCKASRVCRLWAAISRDNKLWKVFCRNEKFPMPLDKKKTSFKEYYATQMKARMQNIHDTIGKYHLYQMCIQNSPSQKKSSKKEQKLQVQAQKALEQQRKTLIAPPFIADNKKIQVHEFIKNLAQLVHSSLKKEIQDNHSGSENKIPSLTEVVSGLAFLLTSDENTIRYIFAKEGITQISSKGSKGEPHPLIEAASSSLNLGHFNFLFELGFKPDETDFLYVLQACNTEILKELIPLFIQEKDILDSYVQIYAVIKRAGSADQSSKTILCDICFLLLDRFIAAHKSNNGEIKKLIEDEDFSDALWSNALALGNIEIIKTLDLLLERPSSEALKPIFISNNVELIDYFINSGYPVDQTIFNFVLEAGNKKLFKKLEASTTFIPNEQSGKAAISGNRPTLVQKLIDVNYQFTLEDLAFLHNDKKGNRIFSAITDNCQINFDENSIKKFFDKYPKGALNTKILGYVYENVPSSLRESKSFRKLQQKICDKVCKKLILAKLENSGEIVPPQASLDKFKEQGIFPSSEVCCKLLSELDIDRSRLVESMKIAMSLGVPTPSDIYSRIIKFREQGEYRFDFDLGASVGLCRYLFEINGTKPEKAELKHLDRVIKQLKKPDDEEHRQLLQDLQEMKKILTQKKKK